ncbi:hypothetical protein ABZX95_33825 [Streptomyces sp. NPDC004232]|uniref:hypothetical protein n=1 Tax=Streptomyces sp. NPDC004232 TaxID=3154454 RepID=UPI0033AEA535
MAKTQRRVRVLLVEAATAAVTGLLLVGCAHGSPDVRPLPEGGPDGVASRPPKAEHADALAAYTAMWHDLTVASRTSDASSPLLDDHARGGALALLKYGLRKSEKEGLVSKGAPKVNPEVVTAGADKVVLVDCVDDTGWLLYKSDGKPKDNAPGGHLKTDATVQRFRGAWKVTDLYMHETGSC